MLDGTPVLLRSSRYFGPIGEHTIPIRAVGAIEALQKVEIFEPASIEDKIVRASHLRDSIHREADALVHCQEQIEQAERNDGGIDDGRRQVRQKTRVQKVRGESQLEAPVLRKRRWFEASSPVGPVILKRPFLFL